MKRLFFILLCLGLVITTPVLAADVTLMWDANSETNLAGYKMYYSLGTGGEPYDGVGIIEGDSPIDIPIPSLSDAEAPRITLTGLVAGTYYFAATAYDDNGNESGFSNEVSSTSAVAPPQNLLKVVVDTEVSVFVNGEKLFSQTASMDGDVDGEDLAKLADEFGQ